ncbi:MAG: hypothetical protein LBT65_10230 [Synergistaceae bacterium]|nr:hypothetical protein [Synergistaceae bacterium]
MEIHTFELTKVPQTEEALTEEDEKAKLQFLWMSLIRAERENERTRFLTGVDSTMKNFHATHSVVTVFSVAILSFVFACPAAAAPLPDVMDEWDATPIAVTRFETTSRDLGQWQNRTYTRSAPRASIEVDLMEGSGPGSLRVPEGDISRNDAPLGFSSTYRTLSLAGRRAILERGDVTGQALAVAFDKNRTLTIETKSVSEEELLDFAVRLMTALDAE